MEALFAGRIIAWQGEREARDEQARGAFRHLVGALLIQIGFGDLFAAEFACGPIKHLPAGMVRE